MNIEIGSFVIGVVTTIVALLVVVSTILWMTANKRIDAIEEILEDKDGESWKRD